MSALHRTRIENLDILKGIIMLVMALDHTRDFFHHAAFIFNPADPKYSTLPIFFTRFISHFCAPLFFFLAGLSAFLVGTRRTKKELSLFLIKRGLWLIFVEITIVNLAWFCNPEFNNFELQVIWALGLGMLILAALIHLPQKLLLIFSIALIFGHNLLDYIHIENNFLWSVLHQFEFFQVSTITSLRVSYPIIPWGAVMSLGYCLGVLYQPAYSAQKRRKAFNIIGVSALALFVFLRFTNLYGDPSTYQNLGSMSKNIILFLNPLKYPPSLIYLLLTLGTAFILLANTENWRGKIANFFSTFGRVPFFYYIVHLYFIHSLSFILAALTGFGWKKMILKQWITEVESLQGYGLPLWGVYIVWLVIIAALYPLCKKFDNYKRNHKEKTWLSYF